VSGETKRLENAERLETICARVRQSIDDPRLSMTQKQVDAHFKSLFAKTAKVRRKASRPRVK
jgi:hypothetical protein